MTKRVKILFALIIFTLSSCATWLHETHPAQFKLQDGSGTFEARHWSTYILTVKLIITNRSKEFCEASEIVKWENGCKSHFQGGRFINFSWEVLDITNNTVVESKTHFKPNYCSAVGEQEGIWCSFYAFKVEEGHRYQIVVNDVVIPEGGWKFNPTISVDAAAGKL